MIFCGEAGRILITHSNEPFWLPSIHHDGSEKYVSMLTPRTEESIRIRLRISHRAPIRRVILRTFPDGEQNFTPMTLVEKESPVQWWEIELVIHEPVIQYRFIIDSADGLWHYSASGPSNTVPLDSTDFRILADYHTPRWLENAVFYQIFPDRFANGSKANDPQPEDFEYHGRRPRTYEWEAQPDPEQPFPLVFYGGDLPGIESRLDYLEYLGINACYLTPIFTAYSNHKYDVADYDQVDPHFGGNDALITLRKTLNARGMRLILDIVPNHCGYWHPWFQTALKDPQEVESEFFTFQKHPDDYATWLGVWSLPKLNYASHELRRRMYSGKDAVFRRWLRPPFSADGWRVDVANMLGRQGTTQIGLDIGRDIRNAVKEANPDAYLMGENFFDATAQLQGDQWDGVMNYGGFTHPLWYWLSEFSQGAHDFSESLTAPGWSTAALAETWLSRLAAIPWVIARQQYNILDSHDTRRIRTILHGNDALHRLAVAVLLTYPGVPGLYYGDEIGMVDLPALAGRGCMIWDEARWDAGLLEFHRQMIQLRRDSAALQRGGFQILAIEPETIIYQRDSLDDRVIVIAHRAKEPRLTGEVKVEHGSIADGLQFKNIMSGELFVVTDRSLRLPAIQQGVIVLRQI